MKKYLVLILTVMFPLAGYAAYENPNDIHGTLKQVYTDHITVDYQDPVASSGDSNAPGTRGERTVYVDSGTQYRNFNQLTDLKEGDPLDISFRQDMNLERNPAAAKERAAIITRTDDTTSSNVNETTTVTTTTTTNTTTNSALPATQ